MEKTKIDIDFIEPYFKGEGKGKRHGNFWDTVDISQHVDFHFTGYFLKPYIYSNMTESEISKKIYDVNPYWTWLIDTYRPSEDSTIKSYRRKIYLPKTKETMHKVYMNLQKITRSSDWSVSYPKTDFGIKIEDGLENYMEKDYPTFMSVENWFTSIGLSNMLVDPNSMVAIMPLSWELEKGEMPRPFPFTIPSKDVYCFKDQNVVLFKSPYSAEYTYKDNKGINRTGLQLIAMTPDAYYTVSQTDDKHSFTIEEVYRHNLNQLPAFKMGGMIKKFALADSLYDSFLMPMLPDLDDMARLWSDLSAEIVQHVFSTMWYYSGAECSNCAGSGLVSQNGNKINCPVCEGDGVLPKSPYKDIKLKLPDKFNPTGGDAIKGDPMGYITKSTEAMKALVEQIENCRSMALSSVNMEYMARTPLNTSGTSKAYDADAGHNFVHRVAQHAVNNVFNKIYWYTALMRYGNIGFNQDEIKEMVPTLNVPCKFDLVTEEMMEQRLLTLQQAQADPEIIAQAEMDLVDKKYFNNPEVRKKLIVKRNHDPFPNATLQNKLDMLKDETISKIDIIQSLYMDDFIEDAVANDEEFYEKSYDDQNKVFIGMTQTKFEQIDEENKKPSNPAPYPGPLPQEKNIVQPKDVPEQVQNEQTTEKFTKYRSDLDFS